ncbi:disease resistance RPP13-like protein 4 isoform X1 [Cucurbita pepo subsp. pepo]|uniref:disease resistance RPP13-like protein 4 isoform X1 n=1 Tax=Cucurbita pepo subsp. pepo TaxID=3664 RepID=UPI000C9D8506|nr:disease resistance RPP13-like protein 4 isoform X1 [Cucurbita pepo subsp. pepo]
MASRSPPLHPQASDLIPTIPQMIESLSKLHGELSTALKESTTRAQAAANRRAPASADDQIEEAARPHTETNASIRANQNPQFEKLLTNIEHLKGALEATNELDKQLKEPIQSIKGSLEEVIKSVELDQKIEENFLDAVSKDMKTLKFQIPSYQKLSLAGNTAHLVDKGGGTARQDEFKLPNLYAHKVFDESPAFIEIQDIYNGFGDDICKKCFLYFAAFPENVVLKKRLLTHWWIGEGLLDSSGSGDQMPEVRAGEILKKFAEKGLIVPLKEEQKKVKKKFTMPPIVRSAAIILAKKEQFLNYDSGDNPIGKSSGCDRIFLVKGGGLRQPKAPTLTTDQNLEVTMESIFNVSQPFPDSALEWLAKKGEVDMRTDKVVEWLLKLKNLKVLYLGRWQSAVDEQQIEVESLEFLEGLKKMKKLRLLSLQGISWINKLPNSIRTLSQLRVLDLKSCFNLETLPQGIGSLKRLTHLDVSGCYMLDQMPTSISKLTELRVLKGFVTGRSSLNDLRGFKKLRKLSINTNRRDFPDETDLRVLQDLGEHGKLRTLGIVWVAEGLKQPSSGERNMIRQVTRKIGRQLTMQLSKQRDQSNDVILELPKELEKLEMECLPKEKLPLWLNPSNLTSLKRLYIRGGKLAELGNEPWKAEVVRLKYMTELKIEWRELQKSFPNLSYLQKVRCPRVTFCPCDANGVWMKPCQ